MRGKFIQKTAGLVASIFSISLMFSGGQAVNAQTKKLTTDELKELLLDDSKTVSTNTNYLEVEEEKSVDEKIELKTEGDSDETIRIIVELEGEPATSGDEQEIQEVIDEQSDVQEAVEDITDNDVRNSYGNLINGFSIEAERGDLEDIASIEGVAKVYEANVYYPSMASAVDLTEAADTWSDYGYKGEGLVVAIIDTGIDYTHKDMRDPEDSDAMKLHEDDIVDGLGKYYTAKVPYGYNFADDNDQIIDTTSSQHGMHVAGIVAADATDEDYQSGDGVRGVAPEAQLLAMKVFSNNAAVSGAYSDDIVAAIEDSVAHGADIINMSLGSSAGFVNSDDPEQVAIKNATDAGTLCVVSAGNSYYSTYPYWYSSIQDTGLVGSPGLAEDALQVASYENSSVKLNAFQLNVNGETSLIGHTTASADPNAVLEANKEYDVVDCGYGTVEDFEGKDLTGKIALIQRGDITFVEKAQNAEKAGAILALVYNNASGGDSYINMASDESITIPYIFITNTDGTTILNGLDNGATISFNSYITTVANSANGTFSDFTSWGPTPDLEFAPQITSIGGNVYSTINNDKYTTMSGTSMSSPNVAGSSALIVQALKDAGVELEGRELVEFVKNTIMNTAEVKYDTEYYNDGEMPISPRRQGAGLIQVEDALENRVLALSDEGKATLSLKEIGNNTTFDVTLKNYGDTDATYTLGTEGGVMTTFDPEDGGQGVYGYMQFDTELEGATISFNAEEVTVPANGEKTVTVTLSIPEDSERDIFAEGFLIFTSVDESVPSLVMPYMGFYGSWSNETIVNDVSWDFDEANTLPASFAATTVLGNYNYAGYVGRDSYDEPIIDSDAIAISPNGDSLGDSLVPALFMLRNAKTITVDILDENKNVVANDVALASDVRKVIYNSSTSPSLLNSLSWDGKIYNKSTGEYEVVPGQYYMSINSKVDLDTATEQSLIIPVKVDTEAPVINVESENTSSTTNYTLKFTVDDDLSGVNELAVVVNGTEVTEGIEVSGNEVTVKTTLEDSKTNTVQIAALDNAYNTASEEFEVKVQEPEEYIKPTVKFNYSDGDQFSTSNIELTGKVAGSYKDLTINNENVEVAEDGSFAVELTLAEGRNYVPVKLTDVNGDVIENYSLRFYCDTVAPVIEVEAPAVSDDGIIYTPTSTIVLKGNVSDNTMGYTFYINGEAQMTVEKDGMYGNDTNRQSFSKEIAVEDGDVITLEAEDLFGNVSTIQYKVVVDENAVVLNSNLVNGGVYNTDVTPTFEVNAGYKIVSMELDGQAYNGEAITVEGSHSLVVEVSADTEDASETVKYQYDFTIDKTSAEINVEGVEDGGVYNEDVTPIVTVSENANVESLLNNEEYDGSAITEEGTYTLKVTATDYAGNVSEKEVAFAIDKTAPVITIEGVVYGMKYTKAVTPKITVDDESAEVVSTLNGEDYDGSEISAVGEYELVVTATDKVGNTSNEVVKFTIAAKTNSEVTEPGATVGGDDNGTGTIDTPVTNDDSEDVTSEDTVKVNTDKTSNNESTTSVPKTGNEHVIYVSLLAIALIAGGVVLIFKKKKIVK